MQNRELKKVEIIQEELGDFGWRDNTLSPLSQREFWRLSKHLVPSEEKTISALFAKTPPMSFFRREYVFLVTENKIFYRVSYGGNLSKPKILNFKEIKEIKLSEDRFLASRIYVDIYTTRFESFHLQTFDLTSVLHFKMIVLNKKDSQKEQLV